MQPTNLDSVLENKLRLMPKTEIHVHLEGAMTPDTIWKMALRNNVQLPVSTLEQWRQYYQFRDFAHFIEIYRLCASCMKTADDFQIMVEEFHKYQASQNIVYTEAFISATHVIQKIPSDALLDALNEGCRQGEEKYNVRVRFIPDIARHYSETQNEVYNLARKGFKRGLFLGLGLGGMEEGFPPRLFKETFERARAEGLRVVAHAGEVCGPESVKDALDSLKAERIGHGIKSIQCNDLMKRLRDEQVPLEVCPASNYRTKTLSADQPHPIHKMIEHGLFCTLNSDDPPMFSTSLTDEYFSLAKQGLSWKDLWQLNTNTLAATFLSKDEKKQIEKQMNLFLAQN